MMGHEIDPMEEIVVTIGAYGSLFTVTQGLLNPGDEVRLIYMLEVCMEDVW